MKRWMQHRRSYFLLAVMFFLFSLLSFAGSDMASPHIASARAIMKQFVPPPVLSHVHGIAAGELLTPLIIFGLLLQALGAVALLTWRANMAQEREQAILPTLPLYGPGNTEYATGGFSSYFDVEDELAPQ